MLKASTTHTYYRIAETGLDGEKSYTKILRVTCDGKNSLAVFPNPVKDILTVNVTTERTERIELMLYDAMGKLVKRERSSVFAGINQLQMDVQSLANGTYTLKAIWGENTQHVKVIKK